MRPKATLTVESRGHGVRPMLDGVTVTKLAKRTANAVGVRMPMSLSVAFVSGAAIAWLNGRYRKKPNVADVLAFPLGRTADGVDCGEILLCPSAIRRRSGLTGISPRKEAERLFVHGALHLFGFRHITSREAARMENLEERILDRHAAV